MNQAPHPKPIDTVVQDLRGLLSTATPGTWTKGRTTHHTVSERQGEKPYPIAEFHHANDAAFCDFAHNFIPQVLDALDAANARITQLDVMLGGAETRGKMVLDAKDDWRRLALQFDGHRMHALGHLKTLVQIDNGYEAAQAAEAFLAAPPLAGEAVLAQRIAELAAQPSRECLQQSAEITAALDRMDGLLDPSRKLLAVGADSATAVGSRADMALIRAALQAAPPAPASVAVSDDLKARCTEILEWQKTGILRGDALREFAAAKYPEHHEALQIAERATAKEAYAALAAAPAQVVEMLSREEWIAQAQAKSENNHHNESNA